MKFFYRVLILVLLSTFIGFCFIDEVKAKTIKIAVIDTGFDFKSNWKKYPQFKKPILCDSKYHKDFIGDGLQDTLEHGTHVAGLIANQIQHTDYCLIIIVEYFRPYDDALNYAASLDVDYINISGGGQNPYLNEFMTIKRVLDKGIKVVVAAGNNGHKLEKMSFTSFLPFQALNVMDNKTFYPAQYDPRLIVVGSKHYNNQINTKFNWGPAVDYYMDGQDQKSLCLNNTVCKKSGTSMATANMTGLLVNREKKK